MAGLMLMQHGLQKLFGLLGGHMGTPGAVAAAFSRSWFAGILETFVAPLVVIGLFTRPASFLLSGLMAFAYFLVHAGRGFFPIGNGGELPALYCFVFLYLAATGGGRYSLDAVLRRGRAERGAPDVGVTPHVRGAR